MRMIILLSMIFLGYMPIAAKADTKVDIGTGAEKADSCVSCHNVMVSLQGRGAGVIADQVREIRAGRKSHPPGLADLLEEDIEIIAAYLDTAN